MVQNLKAVQTDLNSINLEKITPLEQSNVLMKVRETILDDGSEGVSVTAPSGITIYPSNGVYCLFGIITFIVGACGCLFVLAFANE